MFKGKTIWSNPAGFSIVDLLALVFTGSFLVMGFATFFVIGRTAESIEILRVYSQPVLIILGGYFSDQIMNRWAESRYGETKPARRRKKKAEEPVEEVVSEMEGIA